MSGGELILYTAEDGSVEMQLRALEGTVWLSQLEMAALFDTTKQNVAKHLKAIFAEGELAENSVVNYRLTTAADGKLYRVAHYSLDGILAVGYRVRSPRDLEVLTRAGKLRRDVAEKLEVEHCESLDAARRGAARLAADAEDVAALEHAERQLEGKRQEKKR